jgi:hypothetical protein
MSIYSYSSFHTDGGCGAGGGRDTYGRGVGRKEGHPICRSPGKFMTSLVEVHILVNVQFVCANVPIVYGGAGSAVFSIV